MDRFYMNMWTGEITDSYSTALKWFDNGATICVVIWSDVYLKWVKKIIWKRKENWKYKEKRS